MTVTPEYPIKRRCDVGPDEEWRDGAGHEWSFDDVYTSTAATTWVEVRPKQQPDPEGTWLPTPTEDRIATTVGEMRDRTDLDQWEFANRATWEIYHDPSALDAPDDFPVIVRRRQP